MSDIPRNKSFTEVPEWATEGKRVAVVQRNAAGNQTVNLYKVTRTTASQVILGDTRFNVKTGLEQMGWGNIYHSAPFLADPASPHVHLKQLESKERLARHRIKIIADSFDKKGDEDVATRLELAIEDWREADIELDDFRTRLEDAKELQK